MPHGREMQKRPQPETQTLVSRGGPGPHLPIEELALVVSEKNNNQTVYKESDAGSATHVEIAE